MAYNLKKEMSKPERFVGGHRLCAGCGEKAPEPSGIYYEITGIDPSETVMEVDGNKIPAELYLYWLAYACGNTEYQINMLNAYYGAYSELLGENGELLWNNELSEGKTLTAQVKEDGENSVLFYATIENMAAQRGVTLTDEDKADMAAALEQNLEQYGGEEAFQDNLRRMGISRETFDRINGDTYLFEHLRESVLDPAARRRSPRSGPWPRTSSPSSRPPAATRRPSSMSWWRSTARTRAGARKAAT